MLIGHMTILCQQILSLFENRHRLGKKRRETPAGKERDKGHLGPHQFGNPTHQYDSNQSTYNDWSTLNKSKVCERGWLTRPPESLMRPVLRSDDLKRCGLTTRGICMPLCVGPSRGYCQYIVSIIILRARGVK